MRRHIEPVLTRLKTAVQYRTTATVLCLQLGFLLTSCRAPSDEASTSEVSAPLSAEEAMSHVLAHFPASNYVFENVVPESTTQPEIFEGEHFQLRVAMPWVLNDQEAPFYLAQEFGYFADQGLEVELVPGGPAIDPLVLLASGRVDIAVPATSLRFVRFIASETGADLLVFAANLFRSPSVWIGLDKNTPSDQRSTKELVPQDLVRKTIGVQRGYEYMTRVVETRNGLPANSIKTVYSGADASPLIAGAIDFYGGWIMNQPRLLEKQGHLNWVAFSQAKYGIDAYCDVSICTRQFSQQNPEVLRRYTKALLRAHEFMFSNPDEAADITLRYAVHGDLSKDMVLRRFELQEPYIKPEDGSLLLSVSADRFNEIASALYQFGQIDIRPVDTKSKP